jgi:hypothetical protein
LVNEDSSDSVLFQWSHAVLLLHWDWVFVGVDGEEMELTWANHNGDLVLIGVVLCALLEFVVEIELVLVLIGIFVSMTASSWETQAANVFVVGE